MKHKKGLAVLLFFLILGYVDAVDLRVLTTDGQTRSFPIDSISSITFAKGESSGKPQNPGDRFDAGTKKIYAFFEYFLKYGKIADRQ